MLAEPTGRIVITWPEPRREGFPLFSQNMRIHNYDTGAQILTVTGLSIILGGPAWNGEAIEADLTMLVGADGQPILDNPADLNDAYDHDTQTVRTGVFRYAVVEMRVEAPQEAGQ